MDVREIQQLCQYTDDLFFGEISKGLELILKSVNQLNVAVELLHENKQARGFRVLRIVLLEEAAKFLILLDAIRCPKTNNTDLGRQLRYFHDHLPRLIYAESCHNRPATYEEVGRWVRSKRNVKYLEGNDYHFYFGRNWLLQEREGTLYVDYVSNEGKYSWQDPTLLGGIDESFMLGLSKPPILTLIRAFGKTGCTSYESLSHIAKKWRGVNLRADLTWQELSKINQETIDELKSEGLLIGGTEVEQKHIVDHWSYPLYELDLKGKTPKTSDLEEEKKKAEESTLASEFGLNEQV